MAKQGAADVLSNIPEWATSTAIAKLLGKSVRRVQQLTQEGVLRTDQPEDGGRRKYKTCETVKGYIAYVEQQAAEKNKGTRAEELAMKKLEAEVALKESQGQLHQLKTAIAEGKYIEVDQAREDMEEYLAVFQRFLQAVPARVAGILASHVDAPTARMMEQDLRKEIDAMLTRYADAAEVRTP